MSKAKAKPAVAYPAVLVQGNRTPYPLLVRTGYYASITPTYWISHPYLQANVSLVGSSFDLSFVE